jgi:hypothetical protein
MMAEVKTFARMAFKGYFSNSYKVSTVVGTNDHTKNVWLYDR